MGKRGGKSRKMRGPGKGVKDETEYNVRNKGVRQSYDEIVKENPEFEKYYKMQNICPEDEWDQMMAACREMLPVAFRITTSRSESKALLHLIENSLIRDVIEVGNNEEQHVKPSTLPWYPDRMAWQMNLTRTDIRQNEAYFRLHNFLISETESGNISRQEAVSMIPPLALKVEPHHKVLDMCASPGSKTAQIIEMLHADDSKPPEGYVIANDVDNKRCYMLVHQGKRLQSPAFVVTNHDAGRFPRLYHTDKDGNQSPMKFDRVLADVPCSGDGTIRKNVDVWKKWNPATALSLMQVQFQILKRGMELLEIGGLLVYSTCSMNPMEDEAVIARLLREAKGAVELLDIDLPNLKHKKGISDWKVCDRGLNVYDKHEDVPERWVTTISTHAFPPTKEEAEQFHLDKCLRILPHQQNTGGFFISLLRKLKPLPWEAQVKEVTENAAETEDATESAENSKKSNRPPPHKKQKRSQGYKEDPYIFMKDDHEIWPPIKQFYGLEGIKSTNFLRRSEEGKIKNIYMTTESVCNFVQNNENSLKIINAGVKALVRIDKKWCACDFRISQEGLPALCYYIKARRLQVTKEELIVMLHQCEHDKAPLMEKFSEETRNSVANLQEGSLVLECDLKSDDGPSCFLQLVGWKGNASLRVYVQKCDRLHYLRLCGVDLSKFEINKFKGREAKEGENGNKGESSSEAANMEVDDALPLMEVGGEVKTEVVLDNEDLKDVK